MERIHQWRDGNTRELWDQAQSQRTRPTKQHQTGVAARAQRAVQLTRDGAYYKAIRAIDSQSVHELTSAIENTLLTKHPQTTPINDGASDFERNSHPKPVPTIQAVQPDELRKAIRRFPTGSSRGGTKLTHTHLAELTSSPDATEKFGLVPALCAPISMLMKGEAPQALAEWLAGAPLTQLKKSNNGVRPIAVGETLRRLTSSIALTRVSEKAAKLLRPHQLGVATPCGAEACIHAASKWARIQGNNNKYGLLQLDFANAFNVISRRVILREIGRHLPELQPWTFYCYGPLTTPQVWTTSSFSFKSVCGVQQGDPLGPLLFSIALRPILTQLHRRLTTTLNGSSDFMIAFYLDDGIIVGPHEALGRH